MPTLSQSPAVLVRAAALIAAVLAVIWTFGSPAAVAATLDPIQIDQTDPTGDASYSGFTIDAGLDLTGMSITQDRAAKVVRGTVTFAGATATAGQYMLRIGLGLDNGYGGCNISEGFGWVHIRHDLGTDLADYVIATNTDIRQDVKVTRKDGAVDFETPAGPGVFDGRGFRCIVVQVERVLSAIASDFKYPVDKMLGTAPAEVAPPAAVSDPGKGVPAPILDADNDGVHDGIDKCPKQAGASTAGCETVPLAKSIKLGTKRVVIDRLLDATNGACPKTVKVVVTLKGKSLARQNIGTLQRGKFCHVLGVVALKKKVSKARVVISGSGVASAAATVVK